MTSVRSTSCNEARIVVDRSTATVMSIAGDTEARRSGNQRLDPVDGLDDVGAGLAIEDDENRRLAVGEAGIAQVLDRSTTSATSESRTAAPLR